MTRAISLIRKLQLIKETNDFMRQLLLQPRGTNHGFDRQRFLSCFIRQGWTWPLNKTKTAPLRLWRQIPNNYIILQMRFPCLFRLLPKPYMTAFFRVNFVVRRAKTQHQPCKALVYDAGNQFNGQSLLVTDVSASYLLPVVKRYCGILTGPNQRLFTKHHHLRVGKLTLRISTG